MWLDGGVQMSRWIVGAGLAVAAMALAAGCSASGAGSADATASVAGITAASGPAVQPLTPASAPNASPEVGTGGELIAIQSDNVQAAGYNDATGTMTVLFDSGGLYEYYNVPPSLWTAFVTAQPHPWSAVGDPQLVKGGYQYSRLE